ncbi:MAG: Fe-S protein assembly co-chaperone HscB, partial [Bacteroidota bacterium]
MNYFDFFELPVSFQLDEAALKRSFYANSRKYHPDFHTLADEAQQAKILELSTLNNEAYKTLSDFDKRMQYVLQLKGALAEEGNNQIPQDFLMEMMDINEKLMELEFDFDPTVHQQLQSELKNLEREQYQQIEGLIASYDDQTSDPTVLNRIKDYYLKKRYLLRIQENLNKFAVR